MMNAALQNFHRSPSWCFNRGHWLSWYWMKLPMQGLQCHVYVMPCRDVAELVMEQIDLFRYTRASIQEGVGEQAFQQMTAAARERAMQAEMRAEKNLHPALYPPGPGQAPTGHYKVSCRRQAVSAIWCLHGFPRRSMLGEPSERETHRLLVLGLWGSTACSGHSHVPFHNP